MQLLKASFIPFALLLVAASCVGSRSSDELGEAYVAPATLNLRRDLTEKNSVVATLKHGERVGIIDTRRRFVKIRTAAGQEGWADSLQLLSTEQMEQIRQATKEALALPSEGSATVFEPLNIHIEPDRRSPAFALIKEGAYVDVLARRLNPKDTAPPRPPSLIKERPQSSSRKGRKEKASRNTFKIPLPKPPKPPENWRELSSERIDGSDSAADPQTKQSSKATLKKPAILESWTLVRTKDKQCGWVLSRNLLMAIPDEVAQYAEGKHITSYFDLGTVNDEEKGTKHHWLWTTVSGQTPYDYDAWRVFLWNRRRHRYETSYRQRDVEGYFPVLVDHPDPNVFGRIFHLITRDEDGKLRTRTYVFDTTRVHLINTEDYRPGTESGKSADGIDTAKLQAKKPQESWFLRKWHTFRQRGTGSD
ncbi:MAG: SH3 domain-containing protein [Acidobacteriaceae bacterium]|nr:SH3 domain-containing protein [Acidobacteriaceae bacterium]